MRLLLLTALLSLGATAAERPFVPQVHDAWDVFRGLGERPLPLPATTVLFCQVSVPSLRYDSFAGADLRVSLNIDGVASGLVNGPQDADVILVTFPATLARGDRVTMSVWDRDVFENEVVGSSTVTLGAELPLSFTTGPFKATCRGLPEVMTLNRQEATIARVDTTLEALTPLPAVRLTEQRLGKPDDTLHELDQALNAAGIWQGWKRPALAERLRSAAAIQTQWTRAVAAEIASQAERLPKAGEPVILQAGVTAVTVGALRCVRGKCALSLELQNVSTEALDRASSEVPEEAFDRAQLFSATGVIVELALPVEPISRDGGTREAVAPDGRVTVNVTGWLNADDGAPRLLRLHTPFGWKVLRLREP